METKHNSENRNLQHGVDLVDLGVTSSLPETTLNEGIENDSSEDGLCTGSLNYSGASFCNSTHAL